MTMEITTQIRLQSHPECWHTVEDTYLNTGVSGITISYWETATKGEGEKRIEQMSLSENQAIAIARAILKLTNAQ
jgi:hypothetical protein